MSAPGLGATPTPQLLQARGVHATGLNSIFLGVLCKILENSRKLFNNIHKYGGKKNTGKKKYGGEKEIWA